VVHSSPNTNLKGGARNHRWGRCSCFSKTTASAKNFLRAKSAENHPSSFHRRSI